MTSSGPPPPFEGAPHDVWSDSVKSRAAILRGVGKDWEIAEIDLDEPRAGEALVRMHVAGVCHSDDHYATGDALPDTPPGAAPVGPFPLLGGHEGAGVVEAVGPGVQELQPGDHVAMSFIPACGRCRFCVDGLSYLCDRGAQLMSPTMVSDGTARRHLDGVDLHGMMQLGTFSEYVVASVDSLIRIEPDFSMAAASLVSCGVATGWGSAAERAGTSPGDTVVVIGVGGVGMSAVQGARAAGARQVVAVDPVDSKRDLSKYFGATHTATLAADAFPLVQEITRGVMADRVIVCPGVLHTELVGEALALTRKGGVCVCVGVTPRRETQVPMNMLELVTFSKELRGALYGGMNPRTAVPRLLELYRSGDLLLDEMITHEYHLEDINDAIADMRAGRNVRGILTFT
jgi:NDMA-dependent alcohol dehydrogenase